MMGHIHTLVLTREWIAMSNYLSKKGLFFEESSQAFKFVVSCNLDKDNGDVILKKKYVHKH